MSLIKPRRTPTLAVCSFAKVNLGLKLIARRADGFHELRTLLQTINLCDHLDFQPRPTPGVVLECEAASWGSPRENLVFRAATEWLRAARIKLGVLIRLQKRIPSGAGLGGGSSNAAITLLGLQRLFNLELRGDVLLDLAASLGSDVPFFLKGGRALGIGRGDEIIPLSDPEPAVILLACPNFSIATPEAYRRASLWLTKKYKTHNMARFRLRVFENTSALGLFENDFESVLFPDYPELRRLKKRLIAAGAQAAQMTGSGSAVFGIFHTQSDARRAEKKLQSDQPTSAPALKTFVVRSVPRSQYLKRVFAASQSRCPAA